MSRAAVLLAERVIRGEAIRCGARYIGHRVESGADVFFLRLKDGTQRISITGLDDHINERDLEAAVERRVKSAMSCVG